MAKKWSEIRRTTPDRLAEIQRELQKESVAWFCMACGSNQRISFLELDLARFSTVACARCGHANPLSGIRAKNEEVKPQSLRS